MRTESCSTLSPKHVCIYKIFPAISTEAKELTECFEIGSWTLVATRLLKGSKRGCPSWWKCSVLCWNVECRWWGCWWQIAKVACDDGSGVCCVGMWNLGDGNTRCGWEAEDIALEKWEYEKQANSLMLDPQNKLSWLRDKCSSWCYESSVRIQHNSSQKLERLGMA